MPYKKWGIIQHHRLNGNSGHYQADIESRLTGKQALQHLPVHRFEIDSYRRYHCNKNKTLKAIKE